jgi:hypothetical protein
MSRSFVDEFRADNVASVFGSSRISFRATPALFTNFDADTKTCAAAPLVSSDSV